MQRGPDSLAHHGETDEHNCRDHRPDNLKPIVAMRIAGALLIGARTVFPYNPAKANLRRSERDPADDDRDQKLAVNARTMFGNCLRKPPTPAQKHPERRAGYDPDGYCKDASHLASLVLSDKLQFVAGSSC